MNRLADIVNVALPGKHGLGDAVAPHGPGGGAVRVHRPAVALHVGAGVELGEGVHALGHDTVAVGGVGPLVGKRLQLPGNQCAVGPDVGNDMGADGVADPVGDEGLLPAALQLHQAAAHLGGAPGAQGLVQRVLLVAEAPADIGLDDADLAPGKAQGLPDHPADDMGDLGGADHHHPARLLIGEAAVVLNVAVLDGGGVVPALHLDEAGLLTGGLVIPPANVGVGQDVVRTPLVELGRAVLHGLLNVQDEGQSLILHLDGPDGLGGGHLVLRNNHGHLVAVVADMPVQQLPVRHVLVVGVRGPGMARRGKLDVRRVEAGQDLHNAGDGLRRRRIHGLHKAVGDGGMADLRNQGAAVTEVVHVFGPACGLFIGVYAGHAFADAFAHRVPSFFITTLLPRKRGA